MDHQDDHLVPVGAVLAGGSSRRMGRDKASLVLPDGRTMLQASIDLLEPFCREIVVVGGSYEGRRRWIPDSTPGSGPLSALLDLVENTEASHALLLPCDVPLLSRELVRILAGTPPCPPESLVTVFSSGEDRLEPLPMHVCREVADPIRSLLGSDRRSLHGLLEIVRPNRIMLSSDQLELLASINQPADLQKLGLDPGSGLDGDGN